MTWIHLLSKSYVPFYIYKIRKGDSFIKTNITKNHYIIIILQGILCMYHILNSKEIICHNIVYTNHIIHHHKYNSEYNYKYTSLSTSYIIVLPMIKKYMNYKIFYKLLHNFNSTISQSIYMNRIFLHKNIKFRLIHMIIILSIKFGIIDKQKIIIPFIIPKIDLAHILGSNQNNINKILKELKDKKILTYTKKNIHIHNIFLLKYHSYLLR